MSGHQFIEGDLAGMLASVTEAGRSGRFTVPELRELLIEYLNDFDEELANHPELAESGHWNLWMDDSHLDDALFVVAIVRSSGLEFFCGRAHARAIRGFADHWVSGVDDLIGGASQRLTVSDKIVRVDRSAAESWLDRNISAG